MKYEDSKNSRSNKYRKYKFSDHEIGIIALALQDRINYLSGLAMLQKDTAANTDDIYSQLEEVKKVKNLIAK
jgi:hypothetical protein